ncbi:hypothetical protein HNP73_001706 [Amaricoccus macauensis]|uniref:Uncharacterized protein n=1 Tax=Amaricoccus macauensis TaxID=57001 RepID=A0A840SM14_9RHOB|nr:hypothetical protein [Amaricoccus macauensis]MBB5221770.1 hypothetical protein [Amaricoccus macauensis]
MAFEQFRVGIAMLLDEIAANPKNAHELQESLREKLAEMQALGLPLPEDLVGLEDYLEENLDVPGGISEDDVPADTAGEDDGADSPRT